MPTADTALDFAHAEYDGKGNYPPSGYGTKIKTSWKITHGGRTYRIYATCVSNAASHWIEVKGRRIFVR